MKNNTILYSNENYDEMRQNAIENLLYNHNECLEEGEKKWTVSDLSENDIYEEMSDFDQICFNDVSHSLNKELDDSILAIGDLGLWNGRRSGYKELGKNLSDVLKVGYHDYATIYVDSHNQLKAKDIHHDGTNYYTFRQWKPEVSDESRQKLLDKIYNGTADRKEIYRKTISLGKKALTACGW